MLPFRLGIVTAVAALCLWGLFSLLDSLREPGLLRSTKAVVVKGCDPVESKTARQQCPSLFCQKSLLDDHLVPLDARFEVTLNRQRSDGWLIAGKAHGGAGTAYFLCELSGVKVDEAKLVGRAEWEREMQLQ